MGSKISESDLALDTEKAEALGHRSYGYYGDPRGYEETLYKTKGGLYFFWGLGGEESLEGVVRVCDLGEKGAILFSEVESRDCFLGER